MASTAAAGWPTVDDNTSFKKIDVRGDQEIFKDSELMRLNTGAFPKFLGSYISGLLTSAVRTGEFDSYYQISTLGRLEYLSKTESDPGIFYSPTPLTYIVKERTIVD